ncbi:MAG TPA: YceI family protein [Gaiellaceae bacterium]|nr:YceI family protein [Gaiellaceae bacterium]
MSTTTEIRGSLAGTWQLDPVHSSIGFEIPYLSGTFKGLFREADARLVVTDSEATLNGTAKVESVDVKDDNLSTHLQSPDFFDAERHPELLFSAQDIDLNDETVSAGGVLTIKGVTKPVQATGTITAPMVDGFGRERIGLVLATTVDRHDFGVSWNMPLPTGEPAVGDEVTIQAELYFLRAAE